MKVHCQHCHKSLLSLFLLSLCAGSTAQGTLSISTSHGGIREFFDADISSTDLANSGSPSLLAVSTTPLNSGLYGGTIPGLNNGSGAHASISDEEWASPEEYTATIEFHFDTTLHPLGYQLSSIATFTGFQGLFAPTQSHMHQHSNQEYVVGYRLVGDPLFTYLASISSSNAANEFSAKVTLAGLESEIPGGVEAVRFSWFDPVPDSPLNSDSDESITVIREIDIFGSPVISIPEPNSLILLVLGSASLVRRRRIKQS